MFFKNLFVTLPVLMPLALCAPANTAIDADSLLVPRKGDIEATVWSNPGCTGTDLLTQVNFGCGGTCYQVSNAYSILLQRSNKGPKPTATLFADSNCKSQLASAGIYNGEYSGCTSTSYVEGQDGSLQILLEWRSQHGFEGAFTIPSYYAMVASSILNDSCILLFVIVSLRPVDLGELLSHQ
ncbi:hypothetical protein V8E54_008349 [Elaphomyces granulatus]